MRAQLHDLMVGRDGSAILSIRTPDKDEAAALFDEFGDAGITLEIKRARKTRSLNANAYAWILLDKLAAALSRSKEEVYREAIRNIGGVSYQMAIRDDALDAFRTMWTGGKIGRSVEVIDRVGLHMLQINVYYGSSDYDTAQMSRLLDQLIFECKEQGIETLPPNELASLLDAWDKRQKKG